MPSHVLLIKFILLLIIFQASFSVNLLVANRPHLIYQYSNMAPRLSGQTTIFNVVFFVSKSLLGIEGKKNLKILQF